VEEPDAGAGNATNKTAAATANAAAGSGTLLAAAEAGGLTTLVAAAKAAGLTGPLSDPSTTWTLFAPTNAAFTKALEDLKLTQDALLADKALLTKVLQFHVVPGKAALAADLKDGQVLPTALTGQSLTANVKGSDVSVTGGKVTAKVVKPDIKAGKSVVHVVDSVLVPPPTKR